MEVGMYKNRILRIPVLVILGCIALESTAVLARSYRDDDYYDDEDERSGRSTDKCAFFGGGTGATVGGLAGGPAGAGIGAAVGLGTGAIIGHEKDKKRERRARRRRESEQDEL